MDMSALSGEPRHSAVLATTGAHRGGPHRDEYNPTYGVARCLWCSLYVYETGGLIVQRVYRARTPVWLYRVSVLGSHAYGLNLSAQVGHDQRFWLATVTAQRAPIPGLVAIRDCALFYKRSIDSFINVLTKCTE